MFLRNNVPSLDLHGMDSEITRILVNEFISDNYKMKNKEILIIHGIGKGILKEVVSKTLSENKLVEKHEIDFMNPGCTMVKIK